MHGVEFAALDTLQHRLARHAASKWNKVEHRLFCHITANWRGTPLTTYETIVDRIGNTRTEAGLQVQAELDSGQYPTGVTVTKSEMDAIALVPDKFHGDWNYKLVPRDEVGNSISITVLSGWGCRRWPPRSCPGTAYAPSRPPAAPHRARKR